MFSIRAARLKHEAELAQGSPSSRQKVTIATIIPNYNHGHLLWRSVSAVAEQSLPPDEIIVVDDGSTDNSLRVLREISRAFPIVRIIPLARNGGSTEAVNLALSLASADYIHLAAADDQTLPGLYEALVAALAMNPKAAFASAEALVVTDGIRGASWRPPICPAHQVKYLSPDAVRLQLRRNDNWILTGAALIQRTLLEDSGGFDRDLGAFQDGFLMRKFALLHGCLFVPHPGLVWYVSREGTSRSLASDPIQSRKVMDLAIEQIANDPVFPAWYASKLERRWRFSSAKIAAESKPRDANILTGFCARGPMGRLVLGTLARFQGRPTYAAILAWMTIRERPVSLLGLLKTQWHRLISGRYRIA